MKEMKKAYIYLEDGTVYEGNLHGYEGTSVGEIVFNTSMTGYQEIMTDPSYTDQIVTMTYPLIGNYGTNEMYDESANVFAKGMIVKSMNQFPSNWKNEKSFEDYLIDKKVVCVSGVDTRAITKKIRSQGVMKAVLSAVELAEEQLGELFGEDSLDIDNAMKRVGTDEKYYIEGNAEKIAVYDLGSKTNIIDNLKKRDCSIVVMPYGSIAEEILAEKPDGILFTNGPGDPKNAYEAIETVKELMGKLPIFGICLGHQVISLACGADTYKMKFGHRGGNHGVLDMNINKSFITSQNHGYAVSAESIENLDIKVNCINLNDDTVEGIEHKTLPLFSVQFHPEACPGPHDTEYLFDKFIDMVKAEKGKVK